MESIKHKMDTMVKEKDAAIERAIGFEAETEELNKAAQKFEKEVDSIQREIAKPGFKHSTILFPSHLGTIYLFTRLKGRRQPRYLHVFNKGDC